VTYVREAAGAISRAGAGDPAPAALPLRYALPASIAAGLAMLVAFPPYDLWWLAPVAVALLAAAVHRRRMRAGFGLGALTGLTLFAPLLAWTNLHTGWVPWVLLFLLQAAYIGILGALAAYASPLVDRWRWMWPLVTGVLWVAQEALRDRTPFGGFPWGRVAFSQGDSPLLRFASVGGAPLVTFAVAVAGGLIVTAAWRPWRVRSRPSLLRGGGLVLGAVALVAAGLAVPLGSPSAGGGTPVTVAIVQGNVPRLGLDFNAQRRQVLDNHVDATVALAGRVAAGETDQPDLVIWPENSSDVDPTLDPQAAASISRAADTIKAPILVGALFRGPGEGEVRNVGVVWQPGTGIDMDQVYVKRHPVPFAEYVPLRSIARQVSKEVDRIRNDFVGGSTPGVLRMGPVSIGDVICFEVAYDEIVRDTVTGGAGLLVVQTNNATFDVAEAEQQLAMVRLRAVEHGRESLMASTVGVSAFVGIDGSVSQATAFNTPAVEVSRMRPRETRTLATQLGIWPEVMLVGFAVAALVGAGFVRRSRWPWTNREMRRNGERG
jgi:apolipoprotein N-acyltransferase